MAKAAPDGHTLMVTTIAFAINASLQKQPYDAVKDFIPITEIASIPLMLVVHNSLPVHTVREFIEYSKSQPAGLDYATSGPGTSTHLAAEMFKTMTGANLVHVPFKGNAECSTRCSATRQGAFRPHRFDLAARPAAGPCACSRDDGKAPAGTA